MVEDRATGLIGHPNAHWPPLVPETLERRVEGSRLERLGAEWPGGLRSLLRIFSTCLD
jgi:hypothetical protein